MAQSSDPVVMDHAWEDLDKGFTRLWVTLSQKSASKQVSMGKNSDLFKKKIQLACPKAQSTHCVLGIACAFPIQSVFLTQRIGKPRWGLC